MSENLTTAQMIESVSTPEPAQQQAAPDPMSVEYEYEARSGKVKEPLSMILKRAKLGYHYAQDVEQHRQAVSAWEKQRQAEEEALKEYREIGDYAKQNPDWANHWKTAWEQRAAYATQSIPAQGQAQAGEFNIEAHPFVKALNDRLANAEKFVSTYQQRESDAKLRESIEATKKEFPNINFNEADEEGRSLEYRVFQHAQQNGIPNFRSAFRDYHFDQLVAKKAEAAKEEVAKAAANDKRHGILGRVNGQNPRNSARIKSRDPWNAAYDSAVKDIGG
jgi:hypothetical protein